MNGLRKPRLATAWSIIGNKKDAIRYLPENEPIYLMGIYNLQVAIDIKTFPGFDNLRNEPEFKARLQHYDDEKAMLKAQVKELEDDGELRL
jgi:hypothetical protein